MFTSHTSVLRRAQAGVLTATLTLGAALLSLVAPAAQADTAPPAGLPATVSADLLPTIQIDGVAWDQITVGNTVYVTGSFANARPAGTPASSSSRVARANLLAYDITTGNLLPFNHRLNAVGRSLAVSPDGKRLYVGGGFTQVDGATHTRLAAFDLTNGGALVTGFTGSANGTVFALAASNDTLYAGGSFSSASGVSRSRIAAFTSAGALITTWNPGADYTVSSMVLAPDGSRVVVGGGFLTLAGQPRFGVGSVLTNGTAGPWPADFPIRDTGSSSNLTSLTTDGTLVYGTGYYYTTGGNFEGRFAADPYTGALVWMNTCHGDSYDLTVIGSVVYSAGHQHDCSDMGSYSQDKMGATSATHHYVAAETAFATGTLRAPIFTGGPTQPGNPRYFDFSGRPSGTELQWFPTLTAGTYTGQSQAAWSMTGNGNYLSVGGEFPTVNGTAQQGLARFAVRSIAPNRVAPTTPPAPTVVSLASGTLRATWQASWDQDNADLAYALYRDGSGTPVFTTTYSGSFWKRPSLGFTDTGLAPGSTHTYRVRVTDPLGNTALSATSASVAVSSTATPSYPGLVIGDGAAEFWRLSEASGATAYNSAGAADLTLRSAATFGAAPGPIPGNGNGANFTGATISTPAPPPPAGQPTRPPTITSNSVAAASTDAVPRSTYTLEAWVKTTSTRGGVVLSDSLFSPTDGQLSPTLDRVLYLSDDGRVNFGTFSHNANTTIGSPTAVNNGQWHHLAATIGSGGAALFVDGTQVAANASMNDEAVFYGRWHVGGDALPTWTPQPTSGFLAGSIADVAVYPTVLATDRIQAHFAAAGGVVNASPTAAFTSSCTDLSCSFDGSGSFDPDNNTPFSYAWNFGDSATGTGVTTNHGYTAGTYNVTLTVTDSLGASSTVTHSVAPTNPAGSNVPPTAAFTSTCTDLSCSFSSTSSDPDGNEPLSYAWDFGDGAHSTDASPTHPYAAPQAGGYTVTLVVTDSLGAASTATAHTVSPTNPAGGNASPTAAFTSNCTDLSCSFNGSTSSDPDGNTPLTYAWNFGDGATGTGATPTHIYAAGTYTVTLVVTDTLGAPSTATTHTVSPTAPTGTTFVSDTFTRTATNAWGTADTGGGWTVTPASAFSVGAGVGKLNMATAGSTSMAYLGSAAATATSTDLTLTMSLDKVPNATAFIDVIGRRVANQQEYDGIVKITKAGAVQVGLRKLNGSATAIDMAAAVPTAGTYTAGTQLNVRMQVTGTSPTTVRVKVWRASVAEPSAWTATATDSSSAIQAKGAVGIRGYLGSTTTNVPVAISVDNLTAKPVA